MSDEIIEQIATVLAEVKQIAAEIAEMRAIMAENVTRMAIESSLAETRAEMALVDAMGIDPATYLKDKYKQSRSNKRTSGRNKARSASI